MKREKNNRASLLVLCALLSLLFAGCTKKSEQLSYIREENGITLTAYKDVTTVDSLKIPDEIDGIPVTKVADYAVCNSESLKEITIGRNVAEIGSWAFTNNTALREFKVDPENKYFCAVDGVLFTKEMKVLLFFPIGKNESTAEYTIPDTVETVRSKAFYKCGHIKAVTLPDRLLSIEETSFYKCSALEKMVLPDGLLTIGKDAFFGCSSLKEITVPASVRQIAEYAFFNCTSLLSVTLLAAKENIELGERWFPTNNGREISGLEIEWKQ